MQRFGIITNRQDFLDAIRRNRTLRREDAHAVRDLCTTAREVAWQVRSTADVRRGDALLKSCEVGGITPEILEIEPFEVADGRVILPFENDRAVPVAFIGNDVVEQLFGDVDPIGKELRIKGQPVRVIGTAVKKGSFLGFSQDNFVKIPYSLHRKLYGTTRSVRISVQAEDSDRMEECMDEVRAILRARHHLRPRDEDDFDMLTAAGINDLWKSMTTTIFSIALFVVGISLVVGGIVIMNIVADILYGVMDPRVRYD